MAKSNDFSFKNLNSSEKKEFLEKISNYYDIDVSEFKECSFNKNTRGKVHMSTQDMQKLPLERINSIGLYFATLNDDGRIRLSFEGSQMIEPKKNFIILNFDSLKSYVSGENLFFDEISEINWDSKCPFLIVRYENYSLGCVSVKGDNEFMNYISKGKRIDFDKLF